MLDLENVALNEHLSKYVHSDKIRWNSAKISTLLLRNLTLWLRNQSSVDCLYQMGGLQQFSKIQGNFLQVCCLWDTWVADVSTVILTCSGYGSLAMCISVNHILGRIWDVCDSTQIFVYMYCHIFYWKE